MTDWHALQQEQSHCPFDLLEIAVLPENRTKLHAEIAVRFKQMLIDGFVAEVERLYTRPDLHAELPSMKAVGYRQAWAYLDGKIQHEEMSEKAIIATRQFAKRQFTLLRSWRGLKQIAVPDVSKALKIIQASSILDKR